MLRDTQNYKELGPAQGEACRFFLLGVIPWGDATLTGLPISDWPVYIKPHKRLKHYSFLVPACPG
jgi:hypothetical protein